MGADPALLHLELMVVKIGAAKRPIDEADADVRHAGPSDDQVVKAYEHVVDRAHRIGERAHPLEQRSCLIEREADIRLHAGRLLGELVARHRSGRATDRVAADEQDSHTDGDDQERQRDQDTGR